MTIDQWEANAPLLIAVFVEATKAHQEAGEEGFAEPEFSDRDEIDWAREFAAYMEFCWLEEAAKEGA